MRYTMYYLVQPRQELADMFAARWWRRWKKLEEIATRSVLFSREEGGRTPWVWEEFVMQTKLLYLAHLKSQVKGLPGSVDLLGREPTTLDVFDRWWELASAMGPPRSL